MYAPSDYLKVEFRAEQSGEPESMCERIDSQAPGSAWHSGRQIVCTNLRPRQVRYQTALRPDCSHSTLLPGSAGSRLDRVLIQRTCFSGRFPQDCIKTPANGINNLQPSHFVSSERFTL